MNQKPFITLVDQILAAKKQHTPDPSMRGELEERLSLLDREELKERSPFDRGELIGELPSNKRGQGVCADTSALEHQFDEMVYKLYGLTEDEIAIVEGKG
jgi:hypothetical protein